MIQDYCIIVTLIQFLPMFSCNFDTPCFIAGSVSAASGPWGSPRTLSIVSSCTGSVCPRLRAGGRGRARKRGRLSTTDSALTGGC
jgi:hypothetical protein